MMRQYLLPGFLVLADIFTLILVAFISLFLRFGELVIDVYFRQVVLCLPFFIISYLLMLIAMHLYTRVWRYAGIREVKKYFVCCLSNVPHYLLLFNRNVRMF